MRQTGILKNMLAQESVSQESLERGLQLLGIEAFSCEEYHAKMPALEAQLDQLLELKLKIEKQGGMNRALALEAQTLMPGFAQQTPLGYFTEQPSATQLKVSLEELSRSMVDLIILGVSALILLILALFDWFAGKKRKAAGGETGFSFSIRQKTAVECARDDAERSKSRQAGVEKLLKLTHEADARLRSKRPFLKTNDGSRKEYGSLQEVMEATYYGDKAFLAGIDPMFNAYLANTRFTDYVQEMIKHLPEIKKSFEKKLERLRAVTSGSEDALNNYFSELIDPICVNIRGPVELRAAYDLAEDAHIKGTPNRSPKLTLTEFFESLNSAYRSVRPGEAYTQMAAVLEPLGKFESELSNLEKLIKKNQSADNGATGSGYKLRRILTALGKDVSGFGSYASEPRGLDRVMHSQTDNGAALLTDVVYFIRGHCNEEGEKAWWEELEERIDETCEEHDLLLLNKLFRSGKKKKAA